MNNKSITHFNDTDKQHDADTDITELENNVRKIEKDKIKLEMDIKILNNDMTNIIFNNKVNIEIENNKNKKKQNDDEIKNIENEIDQIKVTLKQIMEYENITNKIMNLNNDKKEYEILLEKFEKYRKQIKENEAIQATISQLKQELRDYEEVLKLIDKYITNEQMNLSKYTTLLEQTKKDVEEGRQVEANLKILEYYRASLKELPFILLNKIQPILEKKVNDLLSIITDFTVKFEIADGKIDIYLDRAIYNTNTNSTMRYIIINNASGFERFIASLAIRIALLEISNLPKINFMAIDEGWSSFDTHNINNVGIIMNYLTSKFDFVLTISHLIQIKEHCDIQISLKKDNQGFSKIIY